MTKEAYERAQEIDRELRIVEYKLEDLERLSIAERLEIRCVGSNNVTVVTVPEEFRTEIIGKIIEYHQARKTDLIKEFKEL